MDTENSVVPSSFKTWRNTRVLPPSQREGKKSKNQWLLCRCLETLTLQRGIQTHGAALSQSIGSQEPPPTSSGTSMPDRGVDKAPLMVHVMAERHLNALLAALRISLPVKSKKSDKVSVLADTLTNIEDLKREIRELKMNKSHVECQDEDLKLPHQDLEQRNQQLEGSNETYKVGLSEQLVQEELKKSRHEKELVQQRGRLNLADEQLLQSVTSVQELASMESDLEQALERVRARKSYVSSTYQVDTAVQRQEHDFWGESNHQVNEVMTALRLPMRQQQHGAGMAGAQPSFLQQLVPERGQATLQDFMEQENQSRRFPWIC